MFLIRIRIRVHPGSRSAFTLPLDPVRNTFANGSGFVFLKKSVRMEMYTNPDPGHTYAVNEHKRAMAKNSN